MERLIETKLPYDDGRADVSQRDSDKALAPRGGPVRKHKQIGIDEV